MLIDFEQLARGIQPGTGIAPGLTFTSPAGHNPTEVQVYFTFLTRSQALLDSAGQRVGVEGGGLDFAFQPTSYTHPTDVRVAVWQDSVQAAVLRLSSEGGWVEWSEPWSRLELYGLRPDNRIGLDNFTWTPAPEPFATSLIALGLLLVGIWRRHLNRV